MNIAAPERSPELNSHRAFSVTENHLLRLLPQEQLSALAERSRTIQLRKHQLLMQVGEAIEYVYFPHSGMISLSATLSDGKTVGVGSIGAEGALGVEAAAGWKMAVSQAIVQVPGVATRIPAQAFALIAGESKSLQTLVARYCNFLSAQQIELVTCTAFHDVQARLGRYLLHVRDCLGCVTLPLTQEMLSEALGVRRTTITFIAGALQSKGIISYQRGMLEIADEVALTKLACPCYQSVRYQTNALFSKCNCRTD